MSDGQTRREVRADRAAEKARARAARPWYRKKRWIAAMVVGVFVVLGALGGNDDTSPAVTSSTSGNTATADQEADNEAPTRTSIGEPAADGNFTFTVNGIECGDTTVGDPDLFGEEAQGRFCMLDVTVENTGDEPGTLFSENQYVYDEQGRRHSASGQATMALEGNSEAWISEINPGNRVDGVFVFDLPTSAGPVRAELHDSAFSGGVEVSLL